MEGYYPGSLAYRNNNPGNLRPGSLAVGATGSSGGYAVFPDYQTGYNALVGLIQSPMYWNLTLTQFFAQYAPAADNNNPAQYAATVAAQLGVDPNTPLSVLAAGGSTPASPDTSGGGAGTDTSGDSSGSIDTSGGTISADSSGNPLADAFSGVDPLVWAVAGGLLFLAAVV
jgi:opacity protein-like surface antigen